MVTLLTSVDQELLFMLFAYFVTKAIEVATQLVLRSDFPLSDLRHPALSLKSHFEMTTMVYIFFDCSSKSV